MKRLVPLIVLVVISLVVLPGACWSPYPSRQCWFDCVLAMSDVHGPIPPPPITKTLTEVNDVLLQAHDRRGRHGVAPAAPMQVDEGLPNSCSYALVMTDGVWLSPLEAAQQGARVPMRGPQAVAADTESFAGLRG